MYASIPKWYELSSSSWKCTDFCTRKYFCDMIHIHCKVQFVGDRCHEMLHSSQVNFAHTSNTPVANSLPHFPFPAWPPDRTTTPSHRSGLLTTDIWFLCPNILMIHRLQLLPVRTTTPSLWQTSHLHLQVFLYFTAYRWQPQHVKIGNLLGSWPDCWHHCEHVDKGIRSVPSTTWIEWS